MDEDLACTSVAAGFLPAIGRQMRRAANGGLIIKSTVAVFG